MIKGIKIIATAMCCIQMGYAQTTSKDTSLQISGSADVYYKHDFAGVYNISTPEILQVGIRNNSMEFGLIDLKLKKQVGNVLFNAELAWGQRETPDQSAPPSYNIQNLHGTYSFNKKFSLTGGIMYRYQTYERFTPVDNFHYTMSMGFNNLFLLRAAGIRGTYNFTDNIKLVAGFYNSIDTKNAGNRTVSSPAYGLSDFCTQLFINQPFKAKGLSLSAAVWIEGQKNNGWHRNLQANYQLTKKLKLGFDGSVYTCSDSVTAFHSFNSYVGYVQYKLFKNLTIGYRFDYIDRQEQDATVTTAQSFVKEIYKTHTLTASLSLGSLTLKAEFKRDFTNNDNVNTPYFDSKPDANNQPIPIHSASEVVIAAIYRF